MSQRTSAGAAQTATTAACNSLLSTAPLQRSAEDIVELAQLLAGVQALQSLPLELCHQLAAKATSVSLPSGSLVIEEDEPGDAMYVVLSGQCEIRSRPVQTALTTPAPVNQAPVGRKFHSSGSSTSDSDDEQGSSQASPSAQPALRQSEAEHTATYWIHKYMEQARKVVQAAPSKDDLSGLPLPLMARYAGHWKARTQQHKEPVQPAETQTALSPMEELLGRGAAQARASHSIYGIRSPCLAPMPPNSLAAVTGARSCTPPAHPALTCNLHSNAVSAAAQRRDQPASTEHVQSHSFQQASASTSLNNADVSDRAERQTAASDPSKHCTLTEDQQVSDLVQPDSDQASRSDQASAKLGLADPNKRLLARMGSSNAAGASVQLMHEVGVRASIQGVLQDMAGRVRNQHQGHAALSRRESFKVSQVVHQRLARGPSGQGFGSHATQAMAADDLHRFEEDYEAAESMFDGDGISAAALQDSRQPERCHSCSDKHLVKLSKEELEPVLGKVIRTVTAGQSFGELALLQRDVRRTASVIAQLLPETARGSGQQDVETVRGGSQQNDNTGARKSLQDAVAARASSQQNDKAVSLLKITRGDYDDAVKTLQQQQLELLLSLLQGVQPFAQLAQDKLISLAVFVKPLTVPKDSVIAREGDAIDALYIIQEGEVRLTVRQATGFQNSPPGAPSPSGRALSPAMPHLSRASSFQRSFKRSSSFAPDAQVAVLGPKDAFGEEVCGTAHREALHEPWPQLSSGQPPSGVSVHLATATASQPCTLLTLSAPDLTQLGPGLVADLRQHAQARRAWRSHRIASCRSASQAVRDASPGQAVVGPAGPAQQQLADRMPEAASTAAYHDLTKRPGGHSQRLSSARQRARESKQQAGKSQTRHQSLEVLMDNVTAATFRSCALRHLSASDGAVSSKQSAASKSPLTNIGSTHLGAGKAEANSRDTCVTGGSSSLSLQHLLASLSPGATPRSQSDSPTLFSPSQTRSGSRPGSAGKPPRPTSAGRPMSGRLRPTSATLASIPENSYTSQVSHGGTESPLFPEHVGLS